MRITKRELQKIINEELEATIQERDGDKMAQAEELAQALSQSPAMMDFVNKAAQNPKIQKAVKAAQAGEMQEEIEMPSPEATMAMAGGMGAAAGTAGVIAMGKIGMLSSMLTIAGADVVLGGMVTANSLLAIAVGIMIYDSLKRGGNLGRRR